MSAGKGDADTRSVNYKKRFNAPLWRKSKCCNAGMIKKHTVNGIKNMCEKCGKLED